MFGAAANVVLGLYLTERVGAARALQRAGSLLFLVSPALAFVGFLRDPIVGTLAGGTFGAYSAFALFGGTALHGLAEIVARRPVRH
jgi:hypothetical protein